MKVESTTTPATTTRWVHLSNGVLVEDLTVEGARYIRTVHIGPTGDVGAPGPLMDLGELERALRQLREARS